MEVIGEKYLFNNIEVLKKIPVWSVKPSKMHRMHRKPHLRIFCHMQQIPNSEKGMIFHPYQNL